MASREELLSDFNNIEHKSEAFANFLASLPDYIIERYLAITQSGVKLSKAVSQKNGNSYGGTGKVFHDQLGVTNADEQEFAEQETETEYIEQCSNCYTETECYCEDCIKQQCEQCKKDIGWV